MLVQRVTDSNKREANQEASGLVFFVTEKVTVRRGAARIEGPPFPAPEPDTTLKPRPRDQ